MITKINAYNSGASVAFSSHLLKPQNISTVNVFNNYRSSQKINSIKSVCEDIFSSIKLNRNILTKANSMLDKAKISDSSITFINENNNAIRFSEDVFNGKKLFIMEILDGEQPKISVILDTFGKLIKSYNFNELDYYESEEIDLSSLENLVENIYSAIDEPLFNLRMFIRKNCTEKLEIKPIKINTLDQIIKPKLVEENKNKSEDLLYIEQKKKLIKEMPILGTKHGFSYREVINQNQKKEAELKEKGIKIKEERISALRIFDSEEKKETKKKYNSKKIKNENKEPKIAKSKIKKENKILKTKVKIKAFSVKPEPFVRDILPKRKPGRPKKFNLEPKVKKKAGRPPLEKKIILPAGKIDLEALAKVNKIYEIYNNINSLIKKITAQTRSIVYSAYEGLKVKKSGLTFNDIDIGFYRRSTWGGLKGLNLANLIEKKSVNIFDNGSMLSENIDLKKLIKTDGLQFLTQEEIDNDENKKVLNNLLDKAVKEMEKYKLFIDRKGWRSVERRIASEEEGKIDIKVLEKLSLVTDKYINLKSRLSRMNSSKACCIKKDYGVVSIKSPRLEFINAFDDGYNLVISKLDSRYGELTLVCRYDGGQILEDIFVISKDGKFVKNYNKNFGLTKVINHKESNVKFHNDDYIKKENLINRLDSVLGLIETKIDDCEDFIDKYQYVKPIKNK